MLLSCLLVPDTHICSRCILRSAVICLDSQAPYCVCVFGLNPHGLVLLGSGQCEIHFPRIFLPSVLEPIPTISQLLLLPYSIRRGRLLGGWQVKKPAQAVPVCSRLREEGYVSGVGSLTVATWSLDFGVEWGQKRSERWALSALKWSLPCFLHCADPGGAKGPALV